MQKNNKQLMTMLITASLALSMSTQSSLANAKDWISTKKKVARSTELRVDPDFNFASSRIIVLDVSVTDELDHATANALLKVYAVEDPKRAAGVKRRLKRTLIAVLRTDEAGFVESFVEVPQHYRDLEIENTQLSMDNKRYLRFQGQSRFSVNF